MARPFKTNELLASKRLRARVECRERLSTASRYQIGDATVSSSESLDPNLLKWASECRGQNPHASADFFLIAARESKD